MILSEIGSSLSRCFCVERIDMSMKVITGTELFGLDGPTAVTVGKFDGLHIGHQKQLHMILEEKKKGRSACVFTFDPAPAVFFGKADGRELTTREEKRYLLEQMGVDVLVEFPMNARTAAMAPELFVEQMLVGNMKAVMVAAGTDVSFGAGGAGDAALLQDLSHKYGYDLRLTEKVCLGGREVSSTYVREAVEQGNMELAACLLGAPYMVRGRVVHGRRLGRTLGIPTINLLPEKCKLLPPCGVYFSRVIWKGESYPAISNIGYKPTVSGAEEVLGVETYLYDFSGDLYGQEVQVQLCSFHREEKKFDSVEELKEQMQQDLQLGKKYLEIC